MTSQSSGEPRDWRRRRRPSREAPSGPNDASQTHSAEGSQEEEDIQVSRTLFSFMEPGMNRIGAYGAPMVLAGIVGLVAGISLVAFVPSMSLYGFVNIGIGIFLIGLVALISLSSVLAAFYSRTGRYGVNSTIMLLAFTGIVVVISIISFENSRRVDVTATNQFSLAQRTQDSLKQLETPVNVTAFFKETRIDDFDALVRRVRVDEALREFKAARSSKFFYQFKDPDLEPDLVRKFFGDVPTPFVEETIVLEDIESGRTHIIEPTDRSNSRLEQQLATGLMVIAGQERRTVYFLSGHGERSILNSGADGYSDVRQWLENDNYDVRTLIWPADETNVRVPDGYCDHNDPSCLPEAAMVVVARPTSEFPDQHALALDLYLQGLRTDPEANETLTARREGGRLIFLAEPDTPSSFQKFLSRWGVILASGYIRDELRSPQSQPRTIQVRSLNLNQLRPELIGQVPADLLKALIAITSPKGQALDDTYMPGAAPLATIDDGLRQPFPLALSSSQSYLIEDIDRTEPITDQGEESDTKGPFSPALYLEAFGPLGQNDPNQQPTVNQLSTLMVFGDSDFVSNGSLANPRGSGVDFFLNSVNHLLGDFTLISIRPKAVNFREFHLDRNEYKFVRFSTWLFLPGLLALMAGLVWWVRR